MKLVTRERFAIQVNTVHMIGNMSNSETSELIGGIFDMSLTSELQLTDRL